MATQKASERRVILRQVQSLVQSMIEANETIYRMSKTLEQTDEDSTTQIAGVCDAILASMGPPVQNVAEETSDTMCAGIINLLNGQAEHDTLGLLDWEYVVE